MVSTPGRIPRPLIGLQGAKSLEALYAELEFQYKLKIPSGHAAWEWFLQPKTLINYDNAVGALEKFDQEKYAAIIASAPAPYIQIWIDKGRQAQCDYEQARVRIVNARKEIRKQRAEKLEALVLTGRLPPDWDVELEAIDLNIPLRFASAEEGKNFCEQMLKPTTYVQARATQFEAVLYFLSRPPGERAEDLCFDLFRVIAELKSQVAALNQPRKQKAA
jgi:hypothetical protein